MNILYNEDEAKCQILLAEKLLLEFVEGVKTLYGDGLLTMNFHNLIHVADDVRLNGTLKPISSYIFENNMQYIKQLIHTGNNHISQLYNRITERNNTLQKIASTEKYNEIPHKICDKEHIFLWETESNTIQESSILNTYGSNYKIFKKVIFKKLSFQLSNTKSNQIFMTTNNNVYVFDAAIKYPHAILISAHQIKYNEENLFSLPSFPSSKLKIYKYREEDISTQLTFVPLQNITTKMVNVPSVHSSNNFNILVPMMHTVKFG